MGRARVCLPQSLPRKSERIIDAILKAESRAVDPWDRDSYTIDRMTVALAARGHTDPWNEAFRSYFGKNLPAALKIWADRAMELDAALERCRLMVEAERREPKQLSLVFDQLPPKKPPQSVRERPGLRKRA